MNPIESRQKGQRIKSVLVCILVVFGICLSGCFKQTTTEQRIVELPANNTNTSLAIAAQIGNAVVTGGLAADVQKRFPALTQQNMRGLFLTWNSRDIQGKSSVFFLVGIRYQGALPEAKAVADYCRSRLNQAMLLKFVP